MGLVAVVDRIGRLGPIDRLAPVSAGTGPGELDVVRGVVALDERHDVGRVRVDRGARRERRVPVARIGEGAIDASSSSSATTTAGTGVAGVQGHELPNVALLLVRGGLLVTGPSRRALLLVGDLPRDPVGRSL